MEENENKRRLKTIKNEIIKLIQKNGLTTSGIKNDCEGYLYCISNSIHSVYSTDIYKLGNTINMIERIRSYNISYFEKINIHLLLEVSPSLIKIFCSQKNFIRGSI